MSCSRYTRGLAAISVVALAACLFVSSVGVSPLFAEEVSTNGPDANRVIELGAADDGDGSLAPNSSTVLSSEGRSEDSSTSAVESADGTTPQDAETVEGLAVKNKGSLSDGATYVFACSNASRKVWDVAGGSSSNGANVQMYNSNMTKAQRWLVHEDENGFLTFENTGSGLVLDVSGGIAESGRNVQQYVANGTRAQKWIAVKDADGGLTIHSVLNFDYVLDIAGGSSADGANVQLYKANQTAAQLFFAIDSNPVVDSLGQNVADGVYYFESAGSVLDVKGASAESGATLQSYAKNDTVAQAFRLTYDSTSGYYTIASLVSGMLIDADYGSVVPRGAAHLYGSLDDTGSYTKNRFWILEPSGEGFAIKNAANGLYLSFASGAAVTSTDAVTWTLTQTKGFTWTQADVDAFAAAQGLQIPDGTYALGMDSSPRSVVDVSGGSASNGANIQIYASNNTAAQRWVIKNTLDSNGQPTGYVTIAHAGTSSALDVTGGGKKSGTNVQQYAVNGTAAQRWIPVKQTNGSFVFYSGLGRNLVLDVSGGSVSNGANVQIWTANGSAAQRFIAIDANPHVTAGTQSVADGMYQINSVSDSSKCLDVTGGSVSNGARIQTYAINGTMAQCFKLSFDSATGFYSIRSAKSTKGLDLDSGDIFPGAKVQQWDFPGLGLNQHWRIEPDGDSFVIRSVASNLVLERKPDGSVTTAYESGSAAQHWTFEVFTVSLDEGCYSICSDSTGKYLDVTGGSYADEAPLQVYMGNGTLAQKFWARKDDRGYYSFQCANSARYLSARESDGAILQISDKEADEAKWSIEICFGKGIELKNKKTGKVLSISGSGGSVVCVDENGATSQGWSITSVPLISDGFYEFAPMHATGQRLDVTGGSRSNGANVQIYVSNGTLSQRVWVRSVGGGWYSLTACCSAYPLDVLNCSDADGTNVQQWQWNGSNAQKWRFEMGESGIKIVSACGNKVLEVSDGATANGANVQLWSYTGSAAQSWRALSAERPAKIGYQNPLNYPQVSSLTVKLPIYCTGEFTYVTPSRIAIDATRDDCVNAFIQRAYEYVGTKYIEPYSTAPGGAVDCSGFVLQCLYATGMDMGIYNPYNHRWLSWQTYNSMNWYNNGTFMPVSVNSMQRGDVIYYRGHIAIYLGDGRMIDSWPRQGVGVHGVYERGNPIGAARPFV
ncbi:RICIN domain-containing protein [Collinsella sp. HCP28S3_E12]|uniref:RICIN domain-containing protein n=1 Tax=Collinsella sp. HCP28S3_E12 TaxID=3438921 RepID=UPI003F89C84B